MRHGIGEHRRCLDILQAILALVESALVTGVVVAQVLCLRCGEHRWEWSSPIDRILQAIGRRGWSLDACTYHIHGEVEVSVVLIELGSVLWFNIEFVCV